MPDEVKLPVCPWCKSKPRIRISDLYLENNPQLVECVNFAQCPVTPRTGWLKTREKAIAAWSKCAPPEPLYTSEQVAALVKAARVLSVMFLKERVCGVCGNGYAGLNDGHEDCQAKAAEVALKPFEESRGRA